jgi:hypothetical protein
MMPRKKIGYQMSLKEWMQTHSPFWRPRAWKPAASCRIAMWARRAEMLEVGERAEM